MESTDHLLAEAQRYGYVEAGGVWLRPVLAQPARQIGLVKDTDEAALLYFAQRFETLRAKVDELLAKMDYNRLLTNCRYFQKFDTDFAARLPGA